MNMKDYFFPSQASSPSLPLLSHKLVWWHSEGTSWVFVHPFMTYHFYCSQEYAQECSQAYRRKMFPPSSLSLGDILEGYSAPPQGAPEKKGKSSQSFNGEELGINLGCHQVYPWCTSTGRTPASVRDGLTLAREGSLGGIPVSTPI